jgi:SAM-dependent methyltransferase
MDAGYHAAMDERQEATAGHYRASFEAFRDSWAPALGVLAAPFLDRLVPATAGRLLDLGSGTGETRRGLLRDRRWATPFLVQADLLPFMLREARTRHPDDAFVQLDATRLPFRDDSFDVVVSAFIWHHVREQRRGFTEVLRVLRPGGRFVFLGWGDGEAHGRAFDRWETWLHEAGAPESDPNPSPSWVDELAPAGTLAQLLESIGFAVRSAEDAMGDYRWSLESFLACRTGVGGCGRRLRALSTARQAALLRRARAELSRSTEIDFDWRPNLVAIAADKPTTKSPGIEPGESARVRTEPGPSDDFRTVCPNCGAPMYDRGCKTRCPRCHFFTDCSDPW